MKIGVSILAGVLIGALVFILYQDTRMLTAFSMAIATAFSTLTLQLWADNQKMKQKGVKSGGR